MSGDLTAEAAELLHREALCLDKRRWEDWLALYTEDAVYWVPAFASDDEMTSDPDNQVSLMYMDRAGLEARVFRLEDADSYANEPLPWTAHLVTNILVTGGGADAPEVSASWLVHSFRRADGAIARGGLYEYALRRVGKHLKIARKTTLVYDDCIEGPLDIYNI